MLTQSANVSVEFWVRGRAEHAIYELSYAKQAMFAGSLESLLEKSAISLPLIIGKPTLTIFPVL